MEGRKGKLSYETLNFLIFNLLTDYAQHHQLQFGFFNYWYNIYPAHADYVAVFSRMKQVQEKKVKKISDMNLDPSKAVGNGSVASSSNSTSPKPYLANGGSPDRSYSYLSNDFSFPPGGIPSLRLPTVVVLNLICWSLFMVLA